MKTFFYTLIALFMTSQCLYSQEAEYGLLLNIDQTTLKTPTGNVIIYTNGSGGSEMESRGYVTNISFGAFTKFFFRQGGGMGVELYFDKSNSKELPYSFEALNLVPHLIIPIKESGFDFNIGFGGGMILKAKNLEPNIDYKKLGMVIKVGISYKLNDFGYIEAGIYSSPKIIKDYLSRFKYSIGIKIPLDKYFRR
jgi:hypothetical protein